MRKLILCFVVSLSLMLPVLATYDDSPEVVEAEFFELEDVSLIDSDSEVITLRPLWDFSNDAWDLLDDDQRLALYIGESLYHIELIQLLFMGVIVLCCMKR